MKANEIIELFTAPLSYHRSVSVAIYLKVEDVICLINDAEDWINASVIETKDYIFTANDLVYSLYEAAGLEDKYTGYDSVEEAYTDILKEIEYEKKEK